MVILKTAKNTKPGLLAGSIVKELEKEESVSVVACGASAINQTVKAIAVAREYVMPKGEELWCAPHFTTVTFKGHKKTAMEFLIKYKRKV